MLHRREFTIGLLSAAALPLLDQRVPPGRTQPPRVNGLRLARMMAELREFGRTAAGGVERLAYSEADREGRAYVMERMREAGLTVRIDAGGNIIGRREGREGRLPPILMGSHIDSVPDGGAYDGNVGSLGALEAVWSIHDHGLTTRHPIEIVVFQNEEGGLFGSNAMIGRLTEAHLDQVAESGTTLREGIELIGGDPANLAAARRRIGDIAVYLELHIEQGGLLEAAGVQIGVVEGIVGIEQWDVTVEGFANHAGTTPMDQRRDALLAAATFIQTVNRIVTAEPGRQVGTVGEIDVHPGAPNVIPGRVRLSLELRDLDASKIRRLYQRIHEEGQEIARSSGTTFTFVDRELGVEPAPTDTRVRATIVRAAQELGLSYRVMPSGAGHDAQSIAQIAPVGMIFVPSVGGISHSPREFTDPDDHENGANVLLWSALALDEMDLEQR